MTFLTQRQWGGRSPAQNSGKANKAKRSRFIVHYLGAGNVSTSELRRLIAAQNYHMDGRGYSDIAYNDAAGQSGTVYEGRGIDAKGGHTNGYNDDYAIVALTYGETPSAALKAAIVERYHQVCKHEGKTLQFTSHQGVLGRSYTDCPGDLLQAWVNTQPQKTSVDWTPTLQAIKRLENKIGA